MKQQIIGLHRIQGKITSGGTRGQFCLLCSANIDVNDSITRKDLLCARRKRIIEALDEEMLPSVSRARFLFEVFLGGGRGTKKRLGRRSSGKNLLATYSFTEVCPRKDGRNHVTSRR